MIPSIAHCFARGDIEEYAVKGRGSGDEVTSMSLVARASGLISGWPGSHDFLISVHWGEYGEL